MKLEHLLYIKACPYSLQILLPIKDVVKEEYATGNKRLYPFWPMVDYTSTEPFLPAHPITILHNKQQKMVPFMTGVTKDEGRFELLRLQIPTMTQGL